MRRSNGTPLERSKADDSAEFGVDEFGCQSQLIQDIDLRNHLPAPLIFFGDAGFNYGSSAPTPRVVLRKYSKQRPRK